MINIFSNCITQRGKILRPKFIVRMQFKVQRLANRGICQYKFSILTFEVFTKQGVI